MAKKLVTRTQFAGMAGVSPAAITKVAATLLKAACDGKRIDAAHPDAVEYLQNKADAQTPPPATGIDPLYEKAVQLYRENGKITQRVLRERLNIGGARAKKIYDMVKLAGVDQSRDNKVLSGLEAYAEVIEQNKAPHVRGTAARREKRKAQAFDEEQVLDVPDNIAAYADMTLREIIEKFGTDVRFVDWLKAVKAIEDIQEKRLKNEQTQGNLVNRDLIRVGIIEPLNTAHVKMMTDGAKTISVRVPAMANAGEDKVAIEHYVSDLISSFIRPVAAKVERVLKNA